MKVKMKVHRQSAKFLKWFTHGRKLAQPLTGVFYRVAGPRHTTAREIVSGIGAQKAGGRWNLKDEMRVVYLSRKPETALSESLAHFRYFNLPEADALPKVVVSVDVSLEIVVDLTAPNLFGVVPDSLRDCLKEDWRAINARARESTSQAIGYAAFAAGIQGVLVPSKAQKGGVNLLVFPGVLSSKCRLEVQNAGDLDQLGKA